MKALLEELKRRNVFRVAVAYLVGAWLVLQVVDVVSSLVGSPEWLGGTVLMVLGVGFPIAVFLAWAYELTPEGIKKEQDVDRSQSVTDKTGRKLDRAIIGVLMIAVVFLLVDRFVWRAGDGETTGASTIIGRSVAVLPFENMSQDTANEPFTIGIHDDLLTQISRIASIKTISRTSVLQYRGTTKTIPQIGSELGAATVLEGGVQRAGDRVRINAQLIDARTDEHLWANTYDRQLTAENIFSIQSEIASEIAKALHTTLSPKEAAALQTVPTTNLRAYDFYVSGKDYMYRGDISKSIPIALQMFEKATAEDPEFAQAYASLAIANLRMHWSRIDRDTDYVAKARASIQRAFELEPELPEAHLAQGYYHYHGFRDYENALKEFDLAEDGMPGDVELIAGRAYVARRLGRVDQAVADLSRAVELDPRNGNLSRELGNTYLFQRNYAAAERAITRALELEPQRFDALAGLLFLALERDGDTRPLAEAAATQADVLGPIAPVAGWYAADFSGDFALALEYLDMFEVDFMEAQDIHIHVGALYGQTYAGMGRIDDARRAYTEAQVYFEDQLEGRPDDPVIASQLAAIMTGLGEHERAVALALRATELLPVSKDAMDGANYVLNLGYAYAGAGDVQAAVSTFDAYLSRPGRTSVERLAADRLLDNIKDAPEFLALVEKYKRK